jgi:hypothetical protein
VKLCFGGCWAFRVSAGCAEDFLGFVAEHFGHGIAVVCFAIRGQD